MILGLKDTHNMFWREAVNVNKTMLTIEIPQGVFEVCVLSTESEYEVTA